MRSRFNGWKTKEKLNSHIHVKIKEIWNRAREDWRICQRNHTHTYIHTYFWLHCVWCFAGELFLMNYRCRFLIFKAWYTDPDLNTLDLTGTHSNQGQNSSHHQLQGASTLGDGNFTSNTGSSNVASASAAAAAAAATATASASNAAITATRTGSGKFSNENDSECSSVTSDSMPGG